MLTGWGRQAQRVLDVEWGQPQMAYRYLGAWNVGTLLVRKTPAEWAADLARDRGALPVRAVRNPFLLPRYRFVQQVGYHDSFGSALYLSRADLYEVHRHEHVVREGVTPREVVYPQPAQPLALADEGGRIALRYRALGKAFFAVAAGSILYVVIQLIQVNARLGHKTLVAWGLFGGLVVGFATDFILGAVGG